MSEAATAPERIADFQPAPLPKWHVADVAQRALRTLAKAKHPEAFGLFSTLMAACCGKCRCWPSTRALMAWTDLPRRTIERHRAALIAAGLVTTRQPGGRRLIYELPGLVEAGYPRKATAASAPTPKVTRAEGSNVLEVDFDQEPAAAVDADPELTWRELCHLVRDPFILDYREGTRRSDINPEHLRDAIPAPPPQAATVATGGDPGSPQRRPHRKELREALQMKPIQGFILQSERENQRRLPLTRPARILRLRIRTARNRKRKTVTAGGWSVTAGGTGTTLET